LELEIYKTPQYFRVPPWKLELMYARVGRMVGARTVYNGLGRRVWVLFLPRSAANVVFLTYGDKQFRSLIIRRLCLSGALEYE